MTRLPVIAGNWKMNKTPAEAAELARTFVSALAATARVEVILCPPFVCLPAVYAEIKKLAARTRRAKFALGEERGVHG